MLAELERQQEGDYQAALSAKPCCTMCFVFVEARRGCGWDAGGSGATAGGDPQVALSTTPAALCVLCL